MFPKAGMLAAEKIKLQMEATAPFSVGQEGGQMVELILVRDLGYTQDYRLMGT